MRYIRKIGVWPVGLTGWLFYESPVVVNGKVRDWFNTKRTQKKFPIDMAGFAITGELLMNRPNAKFIINETVGFMETKFIESLGVTMDDLEPRADNCTKVGMQFGKIHSLLWANLYVKHWLTWLFVMIALYGRTDMIVWVGDGWLFSPFSHAFYGAQHCWYHQLRSVFNLWLSKGRLNHGPWRDLSLSIAMSFVMRNRLEQRHICYICNFSQ